MAHTSWLTGSLVYLAAAVLAVPIARFLGLGSIIGYLGAGILIGPWGLKLVTNPEDMLQIAEFGVVLMLFLIGLELEPQRLWSLRKSIFGWGSVQLFGSSLLLAGVGLACGVDWRLAIVAAIGLAMSSTAIGLGVLAERNIMATTSGEAILSVSLLQDIAAIPILALLPFLALTATEGTDGGGWLGAAKAIVTIAAVILGGRLLLRPAAALDRQERHAGDLHRGVAAARRRHRVADERRRPVDGARRLPRRRAARRERIPARARDRHRAVQGPVPRPLLHRRRHEHRLRGVLAQPFLIAAVVSPSCSSRRAALWAMTRLMPIPQLERPVFIILLAQGGEFGFVVFQTATQAGVITPRSPRS